MKKIIAATIGGLGLALVVPQVAYSAAAHHSTEATYTLAQVAPHKTATDCWSAVAGGVYNLTAWLPQHPEFATSTASICGVDATQFFAKSSVSSHPTGSHDSSSQGEKGHAGTGHRGQGQDRAAVAKSRHAVHSDGSDHGRKGRTSIFASLRPYRIGRLGLVPSTPPSSTPPSSTPPSSTPPSSTPPSSTPPSTTGYTMAQVAQHAVITDCWTAISGNVYNLTAFAKVHSGGSAVLAPACGKDGLSVLQGAPHGTSKLSGIAQYKIGPLV